MSPIFRQGVDINNNGTIDSGEEGCIADGGSGCPPNGKISVGGNDYSNDPNCGRATLDDMEDSSTSNYSACSYDTSSAVKFLVDIYDLSNQYLTDSWGNPYQWSDPDPLKHHKFWSFGPNGSSGTVAGDTADDIVF